MSTVCASKRNPRAPRNQNECERKQRAECCTPAPRHGARTRENDGTPTALKVAIQPAEVLYQTLGLYTREKRKRRVSIRLTQGQRVGWEGWSVKVPTFSRL